MVEFGEFQEYDASGLPVNEPGSEAEVPPVSQEAIDAAAAMLGVDNYTGTETMDEMNEKNVYFVDSYEDGFPGM